VPNAEAAFVAPAPIERVRELLSDLDFVASAIPQVRSVEKTGPDSANWTVELRFGMVKRTMVFRGDVYERTPDAMRFRATSSEATVEGAIRLAPRDDGRSTDVTVSLSMRGEGPLRFIIDNYLASRVRGDADAFAHALERRVTGERSGAENA
jgi:carbon monoxide dehydrogenase subunit G